MKRDFEESAITKTYQFAETDGMSKLKASSVDTAKMNTMKLEQLNLIEPMTRSITDTPQTPHSMGTPRIGIPLAIVADEEDIKEEIEEMKSPSLDLSDDDFDSVIIPIVDDRSFGHRFNYINPEDEWYIAPRFENLKQEIIGDLELDRYDYTKLKAQKFMDCAWIRGLQSDIQYNHISVGDPISQQHVMALVLYTEYAILQQNIKNTFFKLSSSESYDMLKQRNSNYHHICRLLTESVRAYGRAHGTVLGNKCMYISLIHTHIRSPAGINRTLSLFLVLTP